MSANTCLIAYEDIPTQEESADMHTTLSAPHLVVLQRGAYDALATSHESEHTAKAIITVTGCLSVAF